YWDKQLVWILGGDRNVDNDTHRAIIRAMAKGLSEGDGGAHLMTFHPRGGGGSSQYFHDDAWLSFNMRQNGHNVEFNRNYQKTLEDYNRQPTKPVIDGEPIYEDHPISFKADDNGHSIAADVRRPLYWDLFTGACGHTYGHHSVWQMWQPGRGPINRPLMPWYEAIHQPGANQMQFGRRLIELRPQLNRIPDDAVIVADEIQSSVPGTGRYRFCATRDADGSYAFVYVPVGRKFKVRMDKITGTEVVAHWYNPRTGQFSFIGNFSNVGEREFESPTPGEVLDWILVLDDVSKRYSSSP
ncbi:MAG: glycoside hydrolase family 140 protein, partial [Planctomycetales bacterium]|nr:glycoside hydrolase family 140 protein [Planctomycetales bacterium]